MHCIDGVENSWNFGSRRPFCLLHGMTSRLDRQNAAHIYTQYNGTLEKRTSEDLESRMARTLYKITQLEDSEVKWQAV